MTKGIQNAAKGAGIGLAVGAAAGITGSLITGGRRGSVKRKMRHAADVVGDMIDSVSMMFK